MKVYWYFSFHTTADAMAAREVCEKEGIKGRAVPVPRSMSAGCGIAYRVEEMDEKQVRKLLFDEEIEWEDAAKL